MTTLDFIYITITTKIGIKKKTERKFFTKASNQNEGEKKSKWKRRKKKKKVEKKRIFEILGKIRKK